jgi:5'-nucleotidase
VHEFETTSSPESANASLEPSAPGPGPGLPLTGASVRAAVEPVNQASLGGGPINTSSSPAPVARVAEQLLLPLAHAAGPASLAPPVGVRIEAQDRVFVNRDLNLAKIDWLGFDMDYTLAVYQQQALDELSVELTVERMIDRGYPRYLRNIRYDTRFPIRGLHVDKRFGNVLKMNRFKAVYKGYHGLARLKPAQIHELYVEKQVRPNTPRYHWIDTLFSLSEVTSYSAIVDALDKHGGRVDYGAVFDDVRKAIDEAHRDGDFYLAVTRDLAKYVQRDPLPVDQLALVLHRHDDELPVWLT